MKSLRLTALFVGLTALAFGCGDDDGDTDTTAVDMTVPTDAPDGSNTIVDVAAADGRFTTLLGAAERAGLGALLASDGPFTIFAPTDDAFEALGVDLSTLSDDELRGILSYHAISGAEVRSTEIPATADTAADLTLVFDTTDGVMVNDATVIEADIEADNGIIHVIDTVLLPPDIPTMAGYLGASSLAGALGDADLVEALQAEGPFTVFAPTNDAFTAAGDVPADALPGILLYHVVEGAVDSGSIPMMAPTLSENEWENAMPLFFDTSDGVAVNDGTVVLADVRTTNGIIHVVDTVLVPPTVVDAAVYAGLSSLVTAVGDAADIDASTTVGDALSAEGSLTVFAPTNDAFDDASATVEGLDAEGLRDVLLYHVVDTGTPVLSTDLTDGDVETLNGASVTIDTAGPTVDGAAIGPADIHVSNGVVHVVDAVLVP
jgi:transforming growth factor-beta-induced protein